MKPPYRRKDRQNWLSEKNNQKTLEFIRQCDAMGYIPAAAVAWEHYRYLFLTSQLPDFWNHFISAGGSVGLPHPLKMQAVPAMLGYERFQTHAWHELDAQVQGSICDRYEDAQAVSLEPLHGHTLSSWAHWTTQQLEQWSAGEPMSEIDKFVRRLTAKPLERQESAEQSKSKIILEVDWSCGIEAIKADFAKAIHPLLSRRLPEGRKTRAKSNARVLYQLLFLKRHELVGLTRKDAAFMQAGTSRQILVNQSDSEFSRSLKEAKHRLKKFKDRLADLAGG
jgi:hypothetical protein